ncbi:HYR domain-containing protein [Peribacillus frigoritolerans]|uniref:HYR domain-containing protein n=1 Tax=Peribacillus frigoritolerans TaxID=450367 RepID=UPI003390CA2B
MPQSEQVRRGMVLTLRFLSANPGVRIEGKCEGTGKVNYLKGNDPAKWITNLPVYHEVVYTELWPGVDLVFRSGNGQLKYDFVVQPGASIENIQLTYQGADNLSLDEEGNLQIHTDFGVLVDQHPISYQIIREKKIKVDSRYVIHRNGDGTPYYGFEVGEYDTQYPLIIDPVLVYSTYLGGIGFDQGSAIAVDAGGNAYVTGETGSTNFPTTPGAFQPSAPGGAFVTKLNPAGTGLVYSTYLGGNGSDQGRDIAVDAGGNAYVTGITNSTDFPTTLGSFQPSDPDPGGSDAFVAKLNPSGSGLVYSTYLGGNNLDVGSGIAVDAGGNAYVTGVTFSTNFPTTPGSFQPIDPDGNSDAFVTKLNPSGSGLVYSTYLGGTTQSNSGSAIAIDAGGNAYVTGVTLSPNFPTTPGSFQPIDPNPGNPDAFVTKLNPSGSGLVYSTYLGGNDFDQGTDITVDAGGNAYVTGVTFSTNFPTTPGSFQPSDPSPGEDAFVTKFNPLGSGLVYSTYLGGNTLDVGRGIAIDAGGNAYVTGVTLSTNFPTTPDAIQPSDPDPGSRDAYVTIFNPSGSALVYSTYLGGNGSDEGNGIAVDSGGNAYVTGVTGSTNFPTTLGSFQPSDPDPGSSDAFVAKIGTVPPPTITCPADITVSNDLGQCGAIVDYPDPIVTDECPAGFTVVCNPPSGSFFPVGTTTVTCTVTDPCGGSASCTFTVTVNDTEPPMITCPANSTQENDPGQCGAVVNYPPPTVSDNCPGATAVCTPATGTFFPVGTTTVTCTATDAAGNTTTCSFTVTVNDTEPPTIICPGNITQGNDPGVCGAIVNYPPPTVNDNCPGATSVCSPPSGSLFPVGTTMVSCTATDAAGNTSAPCSFRVTVYEVERPTIICSGNITQDNDPGVCGAIVNYPPPTVNDNCPGATSVCFPPSGSFFPVGTTMVACRAVDAAGNISTRCSFTVTVKDTEPPVIKGPADFTVCSDRCSNGAIVHFDPIVSDNCPGVTVVCTPASGSFFPPCTTTVICKATDAAGNTSICSFDVTVIV